MRKILSKLDREGIEYRMGSAGGGNQLRQPYLKKYTKNINLKKFKNVDHVHFYGMYIGNFPTLKKEKIDWLIQVINNV